MFYRTWKTHKNVNHIKFFAFHYKFKEKNYMMASGHSRELQRG